MAISDLILIIGFSAIGLVVYTKFVFSRGFKLGARAALIFVESKRMQAEEAKVQSERNANYSSESQKTESH